MDRHDTGSRAFGAAAPSCLSVFLPRARRRRPPCLVPALIAALLATACATTRTDPARGSDRPGRISPQEIEQVHAATAWQAISLLRPGFLRMRTRTPPAALVDGVLQPLESLHDIQRGAVDSVFYMPPAEASLRYGASAAGGLIVVVTRNR